MFGLAGGAGILQGSMDSMKQSAVDQANFAAETFQENLQNTQAYTRLDQAMQGANKLLEKANEQYEALMKNC